MIDRTLFFKLVIGMAVCFLIWQIYIVKPSMIAPEAEFLKSNKFQAQNQSQQQQEQQNMQKEQEQHEQQKQEPQQAVSTSQHAVSGSHNIIQLNDSIENKITPTQTIHAINLSLFNYEALPTNDISNLIDLHNFEFIINQKSCSEESAASDVNNISLSSFLKSYEKRNSDAGSPLLLILVPSAPGNYKKRLLIRETWGSPANKTNNIRLIFLLAAVKDIKDQQSLENENRIYSDIVQGNFMDAYRNMTYKHVMGLKWFTYFCPNAEYVLKMDDDVFANIPNLIDFLNNNASRSDLLFCQEHIGASILRNQSKWSVSEKEYPGEYYPPYCPGYSILYSQDVAFRLYLEAQKSAYFWIDDVHITGTLAQQANITITSFVEFLLPRSTCEELLAGNLSITSIEFLFTWPYISQQQISELWKLVWTPLGLW